MKFFIPLGFRYGKDEQDTYSHVGCVYGPYEDQEAVDGALTRLYPNDKKEQFLVFDGEVFSVKPSVLEKPEDEKRDPGDMNNYVKEGEGYKCKDCATGILGAQVAHSVHIKGMGGAGTGECEYSTVPYCPNCEKKPDFYGTPVEIEA